MGIEKVPPAYRLARHQTGLRGAGRFPPIQELGTVIDAKRIEGFLIEYFDKKLEQHGLSTKISGLDMDSLSLVEFVMDFEERFGVELNVDKLEKDMSLSDFVAMVLKDSA